MYKVMSDRFGWLTAYPTLNGAIERADGMKFRFPDDKYTVWFEGEKVYTA